MRSFLRQVATSDALAEDGLKVIAYFDALVEHRATLEACVRAAAALSQCVAGLQESSSPLGVRFDRRGLVVHGPPAPSTRCVVRIGERDAGEVWLERDEGPAPLDELIVERLAHAAGALWRSSPRPSRSTAGLVELVVSTRTAPDERNRALQLLGLASGQPLDVAAVASADTDQLAAGLVRVHQTVRTQYSADNRPVVYSALLGNIGIVLAQPGLTSSAAESATGEPFPELDPGFVVGTARGRPAELAAESWQQAQAARRFCGLLGLGSVVDYDELGSLATLAELPQDAIVSNPDVRAIAELMSTARGPAVVETLQQRFASGSIRETAAALYLHHSSVRYRLQRAENSLGLDFDDPRSRIRAELALILWRMSSS
jgi:hypothetical protein